MQAGALAFPALPASEYEQGFDFSLSTPPNLNTFLSAIRRIPSWSVFNFQTRNIKAYPTSQPKFMTQKNKSERFWS